MNTFQSRNDDRPLERGPTRRGVGLGFVAFAAGCGEAPDLSPGEQGRVARVSDGDLLALDTGQRVRLVEIEAPSLGYRERPSAPFAEESRAALEAACVGRMARLFYGGLSRDRYDRALAHVIASDETGGAVWLNGYMVRQGAARVRTYPDNARRARQLLDLEQEARKAGKGLWALPDYRVRSPGDLADAPYFALVEGVLAALANIPGDGVARMRGLEIAVDLGERLGPPDSVLDFRVGRPVRVRGRIDTRAGQPQIRITHWAQVETPASDA
ncbi:MAG: thermonuclease family protein [Alphaproteobacteria bacterium]|nr:thermonuclease family protein [Alphaproteobacteria bacterium]